MKSSNPLGVNALAVESAEDRERLTTVINRVRRIVDQDQDDLTPPHRLTQEDYETAIAEVPPEHRPLFDEIWNERVDENEREIQEWRDQALHRLVTAEELSSPILTVEEAAGIARISTQRLYNIISDIKRETNRPPAFVVDGGGRLTQKIDRQLFFDWLRSHKPCRGRPNPMLAR